MSQPAITRFKRFDVRPLLARGEEPFPLIRERVNALKADEGLLVIAPFLPSPLIELLRSEGFASRIEHGGAGEWMISFWRAAV